MPISNLCLTFKLSVAQALLQKRYWGKAGARKAGGWQKRESGTRSFTLHKTCNGGVRIVKFFFELTWIGKRSCWWRMVGGGGALLVSGAIT